jgi:N utilization substance protein B
VTARIERPPARRSHRRRHRARRAALQMLFQCEVGRLPIAQVRETFWVQVPGAGTHGTGGLRAAAIRVAEGVLAEAGEIDALISEAAEHWRIERMQVVDRLVLRMAVYEFLREPATPGTVIINEALELARAFSGEESVRFVNGILDAIRRRLGRS